MKLSILLAVFVAVAYAGWCDDKFQSQKRKGIMIGCDGSTAKTCYCKKKKSKYKCDKQSEVRCSYKCVSKKGCVAAPTPAVSELCSPATVVNTNVSRQCSMVTTAGYKVWKNKISTVVLNSGVDRVAEDDNWWDAYRVEMISQNITVDGTNVTVGADNVTHLKQLWPKVYDAWDATCNTKKNQYHCRRGFPQCEMVSGKGKGKNSVCVTSCQHLDTCADAIYKACQNNTEVPSYFNATKNSSSAMNCNQYKDLYPNNIADGKRKCLEFCSEYQNDNVSSAQVITSSVLMLAFPLFVLFL